MNHVKLASIVSASYERLDIERDPVSDDAKIALDGILSPADYIHSTVGVDGFCLQYPGVVVFSFRGTDSLVDFTEDLHMQMVDFNGTKVHQGMWEQYESIREQVQQQLQVCKGVSKDSKIVFTGHSSGGCIACLCACEFGADELVVFGMPKLGNFQLAAVLEKACPLATLYANGADPVPKMPLSSDYAHPMSVTKLGRDLFPFIALASSLIYHSHTQYSLAMRGLTKTPGVIDYWNEFTSFVAHMMPSRARP